jgi:hypothetical protein
MIGFSIKEFNELHHSIKLTVYGLVLMSPFWFLNIFLFSKSFFNANQLYISITAAYCITISWLFTSSVLSALIDEVNRLTGSIPKDNAKEPATLGGIILGFLFLIILTPIWFFLKLGLISFLSSAFGFELFFIFLFIIVKRKLRKMKANF